MRSLRLDRFTLSLIGLIASVILLSAWIIWFFLARISMYEITTDLQITKDGDIQANYPAKAKERIQVGQMALLQVEQKIPLEGNTQNGSTEKMTSIKTMVMKVDSREKDGQIVINLAPLEETFYTIFMQGDAPPKNTKTRLEVEVENISPFTLVQRASKQYMNASSALPNPKGPND
jgi:hypothetical protein